MLCIPSLYHVPASAQNLGSAFNLGYLAAMLPGACILHAARHPADMALSAFQQASRPSEAPWSFNVTRECCPSRSLAFNP